MERFFAIHWQYRNRICLYAELPFDKVFYFVEKKFFANSMAVSDG